MSVEIEQSKSKAYEDEDDHVIFGHSKWNGYYHEANSDNTLCDSKSQY